MTPTLPLILSEEPVPRGLSGPVKALKPSAAAVYASYDGQLAWFQGRPLSWSQQFMSKYRTRYEVDLSDHRRKAHLKSWPLPSQDQAHCFDAVVDVGFRVHDPVEVVRRNVTDALVVVYGHIAAVLRVIARGYSIHQADLAELRMNHECAREMMLPEGITIYRCVVDLRLDEAARGYVENLTKADRDMQLAIAAQRLAEGEAHGKQVIDGIELEGRLARERREQAVRLELQEERHRLLGDGDLDINRLITLFVLEHPDKAAEAVEMRTKWEAALIARQEQFDERSVEVFRFMVESKLIQPADVEVIRRQALDRAQGAVLPGGPHVGWDRPAASSGRTAPPPPVAGPLPPVAAPPPAGAHSPLVGTVVTNGPADAASGGGPVTGVLPIYLLLDESAAVAGCLPGLNNALRGLHSALLTPPESAAGLRLAVLGAAGETTLHLPLAAVEWTTVMPELTVRAGARHDLAFERLRALVAQDLARLKAEHPVVHRPVLFVLFGGPCEEDSVRWREALRALTDPVANPGHPTVIAVGIGRADETEIRTVAHHPELAFLAEPGLDLPTAAERFASLLRDSVLYLGRGLAGGRLDLFIECPPGLRRLGGTR
ncbi:vWA domain-containing protein [Kitasatospora sp. NPDC094028]